MLELRTKINRIQGIKMATKDNVNVSLFDTRGIFDLVVPEQFPRIQVNIKPGTCGRFNNAHRME